MAQCSPSRKRSRACATPFTTRLCWCDVCAYNFLSGLRSNRMCKCKETFNSDVRHSRLCRPCRDAFKGHGHACCEWMWVEETTAPCEGGAMEVSLPPESGVDVEMEEYSIPTEREKEMSRRILWCIAHSLCPANTHLHLAPSTPEQDALFGARGPPWHPDGTLKHDAVSYGRKSDMRIDPQRMLRDYENVPKGWACTKCATWVNLPPRPFVGGGVEPFYWWWCQSCRKSGSNSEKKTMREGSSRLDVAAAGTLDIRGWGMVPGEKRGGFK